MSTTFRPTDQTESITASTKTVLAADSGTTYFLNRAAGIAVTLPSAADGLRYHFVVGTAFTANGTITTAATSEYFLGGVNELETDSTQDGPSGVVGDTADVLTMVANLCVDGDHFEIVSDGSHWYLRGQVKLDGACTIA